MNNYLHCLGLTAWRKKSTVLVALGLLTLIILGLQYSRIEDKQFYKGQDELLVENLQVDNNNNNNNNNNVKFLGNLNNVKPSAGAANQEAGVSKLQQKSRVGGLEGLESEQQLGVPYVNLDPVRPFVPKRRIVHFDLKGAPPKVAFFQRFFPLIRNLGATGILLEYEDMFPFTGTLRSISAKNAYTPDQINQIIKLAENSKLEVIPLIQTFGHMEFALKHQEFSRIREVEGSPQALCPSKNSSLDFLKEMVSQVMSFHRKTKYLHIGCDEVFQMGECELCRLELHENLFLRHVRNVAQIILDKHPGVKLIIWDDMLRHLSQQVMTEINLGGLVEPMVWVYAEDIYRFVQPQVWEKYAAVFRTVWAASAFKGAFGETLYTPDAKRHLENNLRWLEVMSQQSALFKGGVSGIAVTGWQRYDHFAVLCELLPAGVPSLALSLTALTHGYFNSSLRTQLLSSLSCPQQSTAARSAPFINLEVDPHLWDKLSRCMFPGSQFFRLTYRLHSAEVEALEYIRVTKRHKGWLTDYNVKHNYSLPLRVEELTSDLPRIYHGMVSLARSAVDTMLDIFDNYTISEWIEQRIYPFIVKLEGIQNQSIALKSVNHWSSRPLPLLRDLQRLGIYMT